MNVILYQAAPVAGPTDRHGASAQPVATFLRYLDRDSGRRLASQFPDGTLFVRGVTVGQDGANETQWNKIEPGDVALFFRDNRLIGSGVVVLRVRGRELAAELQWQPDADTGLSYELAFVIKDVQEWNAPRRDLWDAIGYKWNDQFRFRVLTGDKADRVLRFLDERREVSEDEYGRILRRLQELDSTDREVTTLARKEQLFWQKYLFQRSGMAKCGICGAVLPRKFLAVAHIKPRRLCSHEERVDKDNVMAACIFGCDALFDKGMLFVECGMIGTNISDLTGVLKQRIGPLLGKPCAYWNAQSATYFRQHAATCKE
jgi:hypothetical protein